jgi:gas vesicle protein
MNSGKVVLGVLAGIAAGALLGILLAPEKGSKTRKNITDNGKECLDDVKDTFVEALAIITNKYTNALCDAKGFVSKEKTQFEETKNDIKSAIV